MSRASSQTARNLTLMEELEKLEQSITLTLQEIDHNFSRAHRIVTSSILPIVQQYAKHSEAVWEGSKFWKQFFEASANVSLAGYEEAAVDNDDDDDEATYANQSPTAAGGASSSFGSGTTTPVDDSMATGRYRSDGEEDDVEEESLLTFPSVAHASSTPRMPAATSKAKAKAKARAKPVKATPATFADYPSPYEALRSEIQGSSSPAGAPPTTNPITPGRHGASALPDMSMTPSSSPFAEAASAAATQQVFDTSRKANNDVLLHRVLDKNYRVAATPHTARKATITTAQSQLGKAAATPGECTRPGAAAARFLDDYSPMSSPEVPAPQLRADLFSPGFKPPPSRNRAAAAAVADDTKDVFGAGRGRGGGGLTRTKVWDSDSDDETGDLGFSPPKTMQFHIPQSRLLQTPAREASRRIVEDLLLTAGGDVTDEMELEGEIGEGRGGDSPSVVRRGRALDDCF